MKKGIISICEEELSYLYALMDYFVSKKMEQLEIQAFTTVENLCKYTKSNNIDLLLLGSSLMSEEVKALQVKKIVLLSDGNLIEENQEQDYEQILKYQSAEKIWQELMFFCQEEEWMNQSFIGGRQHKEMIGIFSPGGYPQKTAFSLILAQCLSKNQKVLYINLEGFTGFETLFSKQFTGTLSDVLYCLKSNEQKLLGKIQSVLCQWNTLDYIPPVEIPFDLQEMKPFEWVKLFHKIVEQLPHKVFVIEFGSLLTGFLDVFKMCTTIYIPGSSEMLLEMKESEFLVMLDYMQQEDIKKKLQRIELPNLDSQIYRGNYLESLLWGVLGDRIRQLVEGDVGDGFKY